MATALGIPSTAMHRSDSYSEAAVALGADWTSATTDRGPNGTAAGSGDSGTPAPCAAGLAVVALAGLFALEAANDLQDLLSLAHVAARR